MYKKPNSEKTELLGSMIMQSSGGIQVNNTPLTPDQNPLAD